MMLGINFYELFFNYILDFVKTYHIFGIFVLSFLETLFAPLPSEIVLPFAGYLAYINNSYFLLIISIIVGALGNTLGSLPLYYLGYLGRGLVKKYGKYFFISEKRLKIAEKWFNNNSFLTIFIFRFVPGFRSLISIPAGIFKTKMKLYLLLTFLGFLIWNSFLVSLGFFLGEYWEKSLEYSREIEIIAIVFVLVVIIYLILKYLI
ncbi:MAG: DedA family protein [Candidatus Aenigmatarchaeota archaeon]